MSSIGRKSWLALLLFGVSIGVLSDAPYSLACWQPIPITGRNVPGLTDVDRPTPNLMVDITNSFQSKTVMQPSRDYWGSLVFEGRTRTYVLHLPPSYDGQTPMPLVIFLHGGGGNAQSAARNYELSPKADQEGFIVVYPNGTGILLDRVLTWNAGHCCGYALQQNVNDVGFIRALIEKLQKELKIDPRRIYATGISNGGMMSYRLGAELSDIIAGIAPVAGSIGGHVTPDSPLVVIPTPSQPVSVIAFHGMLDENVPYNGGHGARASSPRIDLSVAESIAFWVKANGCNPTPTTEISASGNIVKDIYTGCANDTEVVLYTIVNGGHSWPGVPGGDRPTKEISATDLLWEFFKRHPKP